jgi:hypothetical protein
MLKTRFLYHKTKTAENDLCCIIRGYFLRTTSGNANDLFVVYKDGAMKDLTGSVYLCFSVVDSLKFGDDPKVPIVTGKVLSADKTSFTSSTIQVNIYTGEVTGW